MFLNQSSDIDSKSCSEDMYNKNTYVNYLLLMEVILQQLMQ